MSTHYSLRAANGQQHAISGPFRVGRDPQCQILIDNNLVSRLHASIWIEDDHLLIRDEGSRNGTQLNGRALPTGEPHYLHHGDQVRIGDTTFTVESDRPPAAGQPEAGFEPPATARLKVGAPAGTPSTQPRRLPALPLAIGGCLALVLLVVCCALSFYAARTGGPALLTAVAPPAHRSATPAAAGAAATAGAPALAARAAVDELPLARHDWQADGPNSPGPIAANLSAGGPPDLTPQCEDLGGRPPRPPFPRRKGGERLINLRVLESW